MASGVGGDLLDDQLNLWRSQQDELRARVIEHDDVPWRPPWRTAEEAPHLPPLRYIGGVDVSFDGDSDDQSGIMSSGQMACAALVVLEYPSMEVVQEVMQSVQITAPYVAGAQCFCHCSHSCAQVNPPSCLRQVLMVDGNGTLHPRGCGLACQLGILADIPTIGFLQLDGLTTVDVKARAARETSAAGDWLPLIGQSGRTWGAALRSCPGSARPLFVSVGHRLSLQTAVKLVTLCCRYRVPEPIRQADMRSRELIRRRAPT
eukprot:jgi/Chlat1/3879/Chrsp26S04013